jgi:hypothetical protein
VKRFAIALVIVVSTTAAAWAGAAFVGTIGTGSIVLFYPFVGILGTPAAPPVGCATQGKLDFSDTCNTIFAGH